MILKFKGKETYIKMKPEFGGVSAFGVILIVFIAISLKSKTILGNIELALLSVIPLILLYLLLTTISHFAFGRFLSPEDKKAIVFSSALRNLTIALGISVASFGESMAVFLIAIAYVVQLPVALTYMKLSGKDT